MQATSRKPGHMESRDTLIHGRSKTLPLCNWKQGLGNYETLQLERQPTDRTLEDVIRTFEEHCNPKKHETVERYRFFTRAQEEGEGNEEFVTDLKLLVSTCNFGQRRDSLVRIRDRRNELPVIGSVLYTQRVTLQVSVRKCMAETYSTSKKTILESHQRFFRHSFIRNRFGQC